MDVRVDELFQQRESKLLEWVFSDRNCLKSSDACRQMREGFARRLLLMQASATIKALTGATYMVMDADVSAVESGGKTDFHYGNVPASLYPPTKVDRVLHDGDHVRLGDAVLVAHLTPGHTKGCTTWTMRIVEGGRSYDVVIVGSPNVNPGFRLVNNAAYPEIASDYDRMFRVLKALPCDIFLGAHGEYYGLGSKYAKFKAGALTAFIDPQGYKKFVAEKERDFRTELARQRAAVP